MIYPHGERRGKVISAHKEEKGVKFALKYLGNVKVDVVKIAEYPYHLEQNPIILYRPDNRRI